MWEFIDKIIYINLDIRHDRREIMKQFFEQGQVPKDKIMRFPAIFNHIGAVGASQSHLEILKLAKQNNWNNVLILEDDVKWTNFDSNYNQLENLMKDEWDVCMLGGAYVEREGLRVKIAYSGYSYIVRNHYYDKLIQNIEEGLFLKLNKPKNQGITKIIRELRYNYLVEKDTFHSFDSYWMKLQLKDTWMGIDLCEHINTYSNVSNTHLYEDIKSTITSAEFKSWIIGVKFGIENNTI
jgi:glycosyl transferase family 25